MDGWLIEHPHLPVDLLFGLVRDNECYSARGYAEKWAERIAEAYHVASEKSKKSSKRGKVIYDRKAKGVVLQPGDRVLVRNLAERGGPGKLRPYWETTVYTVKKQLSENPVDIVSPETRDQKKSKHYTVISCCWSIIYLLRLLHIIPSRQLRTSRNTDKHT